MNVLLGSNLIEDCDAALYVNGAEVFRFREGAVDGQLICDFDVRDINNNRIARIAKNQVVHVAQGFTYEAKADSSAVRGKSGEVIARIDRLDPNTLKISGTFHVDGHTIVVTDQSLQSGGVTMSGNVISGFGKAIAIDKGSFAIGSR
jgi:hypothetical protein